jgi:hypothetical protein
MFPSSNSVVDKRPIGNPVDPFDARNARAALYKLMRMHDSVDIRFGYLKELPEENLIEIHYEILLPFETLPKRHGFPCYCMLGTAIKRYYPYDCFYAHRVAYMTIPANLGSVA